MCRILLCSDEPVLAEGLRRVLSADRCFRLTIVYANFEATVQAGEDDSFDILLLDWNSGFSVGDIIDMQNRFPSYRLVLWVRGISTELAFQAIEHGVRGILQKTAPPEVVLQCMRVVFSGGFWFEDALKTRVVSSSAFNLTRREGDLVAMLAQGMKNKEIGSILFLTEATVKVYLSKLYRKLGVKDRFELALYGLKNMTQAERAIGEDSRRFSTPATKPPAKSSWLRTIVVERQHWNPSNR